MIDLAIYRAKLSNKDDLSDVLISGGVIKEIRRAGEKIDAQEEIDADGRFLSPGFIDSHTHLDKTCVISDKESPTLELAVQNYSSYIKDFSPEELAADIKRRARKTLRKAVAAGTTCIRIHVNIEASSGIESIVALNELRDELSPYIDIYITALPNFYDGQEAQKKRLEFLDEIARNLLVDAIGGAQHLHENKMELTHELFRIAVKHDLDLDFHIDEHDDPNIDTFLETAQLTKKYGYEGRVSCGHVTALCRVDDDLAAEAIELAKEADLQIITLPSCNLYLMSRSDSEPIARGVTRIKEFLEAGVNISYASDNIRDPFRPIGNADMLEEGLLTGQVAQMLTDSQFEIIHKMGTINPARALRLDNYGLEEGKQADLVLLDAPDIATAFRDQATRLAVIKNGAVVATNTSELTISL